MREVTSKAAKRFAIKKYCIPVAGHWQFDMNRGETEAKSSRKLCGVFIVVTSRSFVSMATHYLSRLIFIIKRILIVGDFQFLKIHFVLCTNLANVRFAGGSGSWEGVGPTISYSRPTFR